MKRPVRRIPLSFLVSLLLHAALLAWLMRVRPYTPPNGPRRLIQIDVVQKTERAQPAPAPAPRPIIPPPSSSKKVVTAKPPPERVTPPKPEPAPPAVAAAQTPANDEQPQPANDEQPQPAAKHLPGPDKPKKVDLQPGQSAVPRVVTAQESDEEDEAAIRPRVGSLGKTLHNVPGEVPSDAELRQREDKRVKAYSEGILKDQFAEARVQKGLPDPYFDAMLGALKQATLHPPPLDLSRANALAEAYGPAAEAYGHSGSPYGAGGHPETDDSHDPIGNLALQQDTRQGVFGSGGLPPGINMAQILAMSRDFRSKDPGITAVVEFRQDAMGKLVEVKLLLQSGDKNFDAWVLHSSPDALRGLPPPPAQGSGIHKEGLRSVWAFTGKRSTLRDASEYKGADKVGAGALAVLGTLTGGTTFDETTGHVQVRDPRHPSYAVVVKLLRVY